MSLKIKAGVDLERLREFGFALGSELSERPEYADIFRGCEYQFPWWHKFEMDLDDPVRPNLDDNGLPLVHAWVSPCGGENLLWFDVVPYCTYHAGMNDLNLITGTVFALTQAGLIEEKGGDTEC